MHERRDDSQERVSCVPDTCTGPLQSCSIAALARLNELHDVSEILHHLAESPSKREIRVNNGVMFFV